MRVLRLSAIMAGLAALLLAVAAQAAKAPPCLIFNNALQSNYTTLQAAYDAALPGDTLLVQGTCKPTGVVVNKDLTITGQQAKGFSAPTLDGAGQMTVLRIESGVNVTLNKLTITGGNDGVDTETDDGGGGVLIRGGTLTVNNSTISQNTANSIGGAIFNSRGTLTLNSSALIGNRVMNESGAGGGLVVLGGTAELNDTNIQGNVTTGYGGGIVIVTDYDGVTGQNVPAGVTLNGESRINGNSAEAGGGVVIWAAPGEQGQAGLVLNDSSRITNNSAIRTVFGEINGYGGGVLVNDSNSYLTLNGSSFIKSNAAYQGGGVAYESLAATLTNCIDGGNVYRNTPDNIYAYSWSP